MTHPDLLVGMEHPDDAGVYRINAETALIFTLDFFTPIVDDPFMFGQIAAANALSDVYAMGGRPLSAMNIICFPETGLDLAILEQILKGGAEKIAEAGALLVGGHSVDDPEPKYGLAVTGLVHPDQVLTNRGLRPGDRLILTKPLGTGIITTAIKADLCEAEHAQKAINSMALLNKQAAEACEGLDVHACTDITGFGLIGHALEMLSGCSLEIDCNAVPLLGGVRDYMNMGLIPAGTYRNRDFAAERLEIREGVSEDDVLVLCDAQTSGGLLIGVSAGDCDKLLGRLEGAAVVGEVVGDDGERVYLG